ncbi:MAG: galactokinase [Thermosipho sp. (in: thermotogales)]|nr:galactokinase [Thermosipho sp. (in: thermotogales)]
MKVKAPGRINLIGEHTDYNDGFVLPFAINKYVEVSINQSEIYEFESKTFNNIVKLERLEKTNSWADYIIGILTILNKQGFKIPPVRISVDSNIPVGSGLSSSAALEVASCFALSEYFNLGLSKLDIAKISREAEASFVGVKCGIMDQFVSAFGKKDHAIFLDTMTLAYEYVPLDLKGFEIFVVDSKVKHELSSSEYNLRRKECEMVLEKLKKRSFRELLFEDLRLLDGVLYKRARHVLEENERVLKTIKALEVKDFEEVGRLLFESHKSLKELYEVSCEETDFIVDSLKKFEGVLGARMVGGGFGGGVIVLAKEGTLEKIKKELSENYLNKFKKMLDFYELDSSDGVHVVFKG